jgi:hypothetical protein
MSVDSHVLKQEAAHRMVVRLLLLLVFCVVLPSCGKPSSDSVLTDFNEIFVKESERKFSFERHRIYSGEGDTGNVYMHVKFRLTAIADAAVENGLFTGIKLKKGQMEEREVILLYQNTPQENWKLTKYWLVPK